MDLYIVPENIKQVSSAFADHDPCIAAQCSRNPRKFYMRVVLGIINDIMHSF